MYLTHTSVETALNPGQYPAIQLMFLMVFFQENAGIDHKVGYNCFTPYPS
jgi:hypothetical protein